MKNNTPNTPRKFDHEYFNKGFRVAFNVRDVVVYVFTPSGDLAGKVQSIMEANEFIKEYAALA